MTGNLNHLRNVEIRERGDQVRPLSVEPTARRTIMLLAKIELILALIALSLVVISGLMRDTLPGLAEQPSFIALDCVHLHRPHHHFNLSYWKT